MISTNNGSCRCSPFALSNTSESGPMFCGGACLVHQKAQSVDIGFDLCTYTICVKLIHPHSNVMSFLNKPFNLCIFDPCLPSSLSTCQPIYLFLQRWQHIAATLLWTFPKRIISQSWLSISYWVNIPVSSPPITIWSPIMSPTSSSTSPRITIIVPIRVPTSRTTGSMMSTESDSWSLILITSVIIPVYSLSSFPIILASTWVTLWLLYMFTGLSEWWISCWLALGLVFSYGLTLLVSSSSSINSTVEGWYGARLCSTSVDRRCTTASLHLFCCCSRSSGLPTGCLIWHSSSRSKVLNQLQPIDSPHLARCILNTCSGYLMMFPSIYLVDSALLL